MTVRRRCTTTVEPRARGGITVPIEFDPVAAWGDRDTYHVHGTIAGRTVRGALARDAERWVLPLGPAWGPDPAMAAKAPVVVELEPEGPQVDDVPTELADALRADQVARRAFEALPTFYRRGFVRPIVEAKRPSTRERRVQQLLVALAEGRRTY